MDIKTDFNFDEWQRLAKQEPERFETLRKLAIEDLLEKSPVGIRQRMEGLQWQIDQYRKTAKTPIASCIKISSMMWDSVLGDGGLVQSIEQLTNSEIQASECQKQEATILAFNNRTGENPVKDG